LVSWNVASWTTTLKQILEHYKTLGRYLELHQVDVLCLQETKVKRDKLESQGSSLGCKEEGWSSYWSSSNSRGFNGVATFARDGLVVSASCDVFQDEELDREGRCIVTEVASQPQNVVVFNVYVPTSGRGYCKMPFKMKYLRRLREKMSEVRAKGKHVVLAGDLNIAPGPEDVYWRHRVVDLGELEAHSKGISQGGESSAARRRLESISSCAPEVQSKTSDTQGTLQEAHLLQIVSKVGGAVEKIRECLRLTSVVQQGKGFKAVYQPSTTSGGGKPGQARENRIGRTFDCKGDAELRLGCKEQRVRDEETGEAFLCWRGGLSIEHLSDVMRALNVKFPEQEQRILADCFGSTYHPPCLTEYFNELTTKDLLVDTFREGYGRPQERFTCWEQRTNARYANRGLRIDFILVDQDLYEENVRKEDYELQGGDETAGPESAEAALRMATGNHQYKPASYGGGGLEDPPIEVLNLQFAVSPHNGIIYTPPKYSDHVGVSFVLNSIRCGCVSKEDGNANNDGALFSEKSTAKTQPHRSSSNNISQYFSSGAVGGGRAAGSLGQKRGSATIGLKLGKGGRKKPDSSDKKQRTLLSFLGK